MEPTSLAEGMRSWQLSLGSRGQSRALCIFSLPGPRTIYRTMDALGKNIIKGRILRKRPSSHGESQGLTLWSREACSEATWYSDCFCPWKI